MFDLLYKPAASRLTVLLISGSLLLSACSTSGNLTAGSDTSTDAAKSNNSNVFSSLKELDYTASTEQVTIAPGDMLDIKVFQAEELSGKVRVESNGRVSLPLIGEFEVAGLTPVEAEKKLQDLLGRKYLQNPQVTVFMESFTNQRVTLEGEVSKPGVYPINGSMTLLQAIALSAGPSNLADPSKVVLFRRNGEQTKAYHLDLTKIREGSMGDPYLRGDDRIIVHRSNSRYWLRETATLLSPLNTLDRLLN